MVNSAMPPVKASTAASRLPSGMASGASVPTISPTPDRANTRPRLASICGSSIAQPTPSARRRPSLTTALAGGRSQAMSAAAASIAPSPRLTNVTCLGSNRPPRRGSRNVPASATAGITSAGRNRRLPWALALACRSCGALVAGWPLPGAPVSASATSASTSTPLARSPSASPARNDIAIRPQKAAARARFGCWRSSRLASAQPAKTMPASV